MRHAEADVGRHAADAEDGAHPARDTSARGDPIRRLDRVAVHHRRGDPAGRELPEVGLLGRRWFEDGTSAPEALEHLRRILVAEYRAHSRAARELLDAARER